MVNSDSQTLVKRSVIAESCGCQQEEEGPVLDIFFCSHSGQYNQTIYGAVSWPCREHKNCKSSDHLTQCAACKASVWSMLDYSSQVLDIINTPE